MYKWKPIVFFTPQEDLKLANDCRLTLIGIFNHIHPLIEVIRIGFAARFLLIGSVKIGHYNSMHIFLDFTMEEYYLNISSKRSFMVLGSSMQLVTWINNFNPQEETSLAPVWIHLPGLRWHYYNWDALLRITTPIGTLLKIDKATYIKSRPNFAKVMVEIDLSIQRRNFV